MVLFAACDFVSQSGTLVRIRIQSCSLAKLAKQVCVSITNIVSIEANNP